MMVTALTIEGHQVDEAANGPEGLERLKQGRYQLVLSDYAMPGQTGSWMLRGGGRLGLLDHRRPSSLLRIPTSSPCGVVVIPSARSGRFFSRLGSCSIGSDPECRPVQEAQGHQSSWCST
jgi:hypothetical protein